MNKLFFLFLLALLIAPFTASAGSAVDSYLDGIQKVCVYSDGYEVRIGITERCPIIPGH
jgi:hypothetical protein